jgi:hypothetical protein
MAEPKKPKRSEAKKPVGRPKAEKPLRSIISLKGTEDLEGWLDRLTEHSESGTRSNTLRRGLKALAEKVAFEEAMPRR